MVGLCRRNVNSNLGKSRPFEEMSTGALELEAVAVQTQEDLRWTPEEAREKLHTVQHG